MVMVGEREAGFRRALFTTNTLTWSFPARARPSLAVKKHTHTGYITPGTYVGNHARYVCGNHANYIRGTHARYIHGNHTRYVCGNHAWYIHGTHTCMGQLTPAAPSRPTLRVVWLQVLRYLQS